MKPSRYVVSVRDSRTIGLLAETRADGKYGANNRSRVPKIAPVRIFNHPNFHANSQVSSFSIVAEVYADQLMIVFKDFSL